MGERKQLSKRSRIQSFPHAFAFSFNVTLSVLNLPNYLATRPFQARKVFLLFIFPCLQFLHLRPKILWYYFAAGQFTWCKNARPEIKERTGTKQTQTQTFHHYKCCYLSVCLVPLYFEVFCTTWLTSCIGLTWPTSFHGNEVARLCFPFGLVTRPLDLARTTLSEQRRRWNACP